MLEILLVELHFAQILENGRDLSVIHLILLIIDWIVRWHVLGKLVHVAEEEGQGAEDEEVERHHEVAEEQNASHELIKELRPLIGAAVVLLRVVDGIAVDEPHNNNTVDDDRLHQIVFVPVSVPVSDHVNLNYFGQRSQSKKAEEHLQPHHDGNSTSRSRRSDVLIELKRHLQ